MPTLERTRDDMTRWAERDARRSRRHVERLCSTLRLDEESPQVRRHLASLRSKLETFETKVVALRHHRQRGWGRAVGAVAAARDELQAAWRTVRRTLEKGLRD